MVKKKSRSGKTTARRRKTAARRKPAAAKKPGRKASSTKAAAGRKPVRKRAASRKPTKKKAVAPRRRGRKAAAAKPRASRRVSTASRNRTRGPAEAFVVEDLDARGLGPDAGGQSGDTEGLSRAELADSESVEELLEEGQAFEAGIVSGVENAPNADKGGVRTRQVPEDDVPQEYLDED